jgi:hypothetical protein
MLYKDIYVDDTPPVIVYKYGVLQYGLTGDTTFFSGASSAITSGIFINDGFIFNLSGFSSGQIDRMDIIDNLIDFIYDNVDTSINKYMLNVIIASSKSGGTLITTITQSDTYLLKFSIADANGNERIEYHMLMVGESQEIMSCFNTGIWRDDKVWIDTTFWKDIPF